MDTKLLAKAVKAKKEAEAPGSCATCGDHPTSESSQADDVVAATARAVFS